FPPARWPARPAGWSSKARRWKLSSCVSSFSPFLVLRSLPVKRGGRSGAACGVNACRRGRFLSQKGNFRAVGCPNHVADDYLRHPEVAGAQACETAANAASASEVAGAALDLPVAIADRLRPFRAAY